MPVKSFPVFDSDTHVVEPPELWERYLDADYRAFAKSALWREEGRLGSYLKINGKPVHDTGNRNIPRHAIWRPGMTWDGVGRLDPAVAHSINEGAHDPESRLRDMDAMGVDQAFLYPTWFAEGFHLVEDPDAAHALARAYNDWIADFCSAAPDRLFAAAMLPLQNIDFALEELARVAKTDCFRGVFLRPMFIDGRYFTHPSYDPLWAEIEALGITAAVHPTPGLWSPEWTSHGPFVEKVHGRLAQAAGLLGGVPAAAGAGPSSGGGASGGSARPMGHPIAPILSYWLDNHMFVASTLIGFTVMQRFPEMKGRGGAWEGLVDGRGPREDGGLHPRDPAAPLLPGADRPREDVGGGTRRAWLRRRGAPRAEAPARLRGEGRLGLPLSPSRHHQRLGRDQDAG